MQPTRREFLKSASVAATGALLLPQFEALADTPGFAAAAARAPAGGAARAARIVEPFGLTQVTLGDSLFTQKRDRMLTYARGYGGEANMFAGPDRVLSIFRANAGLDTKGALPVGSWENGTGYLRGHYAGHFMSMLAQATRFSSRSSTTWCATFESVRMHWPRRHNAQLAVRPAGLAAHCNSPARRSGSLNT